MPRLRPALILALLLALPAAAQPAPQYLTPTAHYLRAETVDLSTLPEPPKAGTLAALAELETILQIQAWRSEEQVAFAKRVDHLDAFDPGAAVGPWFTRQRLPRCAQLLEEALGDGEAVNYVAKLKFKRLRPPFQDDRVHPVTPLQKPTGTPTAGFYSYPSGHATSIFLLAELVAALVPDRAGAVRDWAHRAAWSRMLAGVHFPSDDVGGQLLASLTFATLKANPAFRAALERCQAEVRAAGH